MMAISSQPEVIKLGHTWATGTGSMLLLVETNIKKYRTSLVISSNQTKLAPNSKCVLL